ncbi:MAG TPA: hypothetical protein VJK02_01210 [Anaerolineales bacterium]|nr:hypothetical protein [Anaerolineales bacterium]
MLKKAWSLLLRNPSAVALAFAAVLASVNAYALARAYQFAQVGRELAAQTAPLKDNLAELQRAKDEGFATLRQNIAAAEAELNSLRGSFPRVGEPFDLYRRGLTVAQSNQIEIVSIERGSTIVDDTTMGRLTTTRYALQAHGSLQRCMAFISQLEGEGLKTIAVDDIQIDPAKQGCAFNVMIAGRTSEGVFQAP